MKAYVINAYVDGRPMFTTSETRVEATSWATAFRRAAVLVKANKMIRRTTKEVTIKLTRV